MTQPDSSVELAKRYHCLTCLLGEAMESNDAALVHDIFLKRQAIIEWLAQEKLSAEAIEWLDTTVELENRLLESWKHQRDSVVSEQSEGQTIKRAMDAYRRQSA